MCVTGVTFVGAVAGAFSGFFGGRAHQMLIDLGDSVDWCGALSTYVDMALVLLAVSGACWLVVCYLVWARSVSHARRDERNGIEHG